MKQKLCKISLSVLIAFLSGSTIQSMETTQIINKSEQPFLFELTYKKDPNKFKGYLLGSQHNLPFEDVFSELTKKIMNSANTIFVESSDKQGITMKELENIGAIDKKQKYLFEHLPNDAYSKLSYIFDGACWKAETSVELFKILKEKETLKPWCVFAILEQMKQINKSIKFYSVGMDSYFHIKAENDKNLTLIDLESDVERLCSFGFPKIGDEEATVSIKENLKNWNTEASVDLDKEKQDILNYLQGCLEQEEQDLSTTDGVITKNSTYARNKIMVDNWAKHIRTQGKVKYPFLIVVGAAHLVGKGGLLKLLSQKNYNIKRIQNDGISVDFSYEPKL